jgi:hypothetical protein
MNKYRNYLALVDRSGQLYPRDKNGRFKTNYETPFVTLEEWILYFRLNAPSFDGTKLVIEKVGNFKTNSSRLGVKQMQYEHYIVVSLPNIAESVEIQCKQFLKTISVDYFIYNWAKLEEVRHFSFCVKFNANLKL